MLINVIDVAEPLTHTAKNGRQYQSVEVTYKGENGQASSKKLMSFSNPEVFKVAQGWQKGDAVNVNTEKDDNGYWQWKGILGDGEVQAPSNPAPVAKPRVGGSAPTRVSGSNYPTADERSKTQVYIVRQSSLSNAVATLAMNKEVGASPDQVMALAKKYEAWVMNEEVSLDSALPDSDLDF